jgi:hypothetical protein
MDQIDSYRKRISELSPRYQREMTKMLKRCTDITTEMSKELVECRRYNKETVKYVALKQQLTESLDTVDKYIMLANLLG